MENKTVEKDPYDPVITCPDCGEFLKLEPHKGYCPTCERLYSENEIRNRCGL